MRGKFAGLGFDPAPGNAGDVRAAADAMAGAGDRLAGSPGSMRSMLTTGDWQGTTAESFAASGAPVPGALESAHGRLRAASQALRTWHGQLLVNQHAAERLDKTARRLRTEIAEAEQDVLAADTRLSAATGPNRSQAQAALHTAHQHLANLRTRLATTLRAAHRLARRHRREADSTAAAVRGTPPSTSWPTTAVDGVASGVSGTSAWTGQVATITLPGQTDPVVALPIGAQPGDPDWPALPTDPTTAEPIDPAEIPGDLTGASSAPVDPMAPVPPIDGVLPGRPPTDSGSTRPAAAVLAPPVPVIADRRPVATHHQEPSVARVVTTPAHTVPAAVSSTPTHRAPTTSHRHAAPVTRTYESVRSSGPVHHVASADPVPARPPAHHDSGRVPDRQPPRSSTPAHQGNPVPAEPHPIRSALAAPATPAPDHPVVPVPSDTTTAETAAIAAPAPDTGSSATPVSPASPATSSLTSPTNPEPGGSHHDQPSPPTPHRAGPDQLAAAPGQQVGAADQGRAASQPGGQAAQQGSGTEHRKGVDPLPDPLLAAEPAPGDFTGVVLPAPPRWDGTSVAPLREAGLLPGIEDGLWATFVITAALGPALIAESVAGGRERGRAAKKRPGKPNRMRAFVVQPGGEQLVMLTLQARGAEGWTTQRALFLRAVAQYRRPAEPVLSS